MKNHAQGKKPPFRKLISTLVGRADKKKLASDKKSLSNPCPASSSPPTIKADDARSKHKRQSQKFLFLQQGGIITALNSGNNIGEEPGSKIPALVLPTPTRREWRGRETEKEGTERGAIFKSLSEFDSSSFSRERTESLPI